MNLRQLMLLVIGIFVSLLIAQAIYIYAHPAIVANAGYLVLSITLYILAGVCLSYAMYIVRKNILKRIRTEQNALYLEGRYRAMIEESGITIINVSAEGLILFVSQNVQRLSGYTPADMLHRHITKSMPHAYREQVTDLIEKAAIDENFYETIEVEIFTRSRIDKWIACRLYTIKNDEGKVKELQFMIWDNHLSKQQALQISLIEEERRKQQQLLQMVVDYNPNYIYIKDLNGNYLLTNRKMKDLIEVSEETTGISEKDSFKNYQDKIEIYKDHDRNVIENNTMLSFEDSFLINDETHYLYIMKFPMPGDDGMPKYVCGVSVDITELKKAQFEMMDAREEALQAKVAQENFLANMSHEIRTPMNGVVGMGNLLLETSLNEVQKEYVQSIRESAENLLSIINDLLDFSKIKSGKFHIDVQDFNIANTIRKAIYALQVKAQEKSLALNCYIDTNLPETVTGDALRLQQMIINLAANAVKFTQVGNITVKLYPIEQTAEDVLLGVEVSDTGMGIPADKLDHVFELYTQIDRSTSRVYGGTGLGLAIVKQLAELQNGTVRVSSTEGKGSVFTIELPYKIKEQSAAIVKPANIAAQTGLLENTKILVAEDNLINQKVVLYTLKNQGAVVALANNGKEAVDMLGNDTYDLILMDLQMPEMDGYKATSYIRNQMNMTIPIIAMTADAMKGESEKCLAAGMQDYISKPFEPKELFSKILAFTAKV